jgi:hypothetical protein
MVLVIVYEETLVYLQVLAPMVLVIVYEETLVYLQVLAAMEQLFLAPSLLHQAVA